MKNTYMVRKTYVIYFNEKDNKLKFRRFHDAPSTLLWIIKSIFKYRKLKEIDVYSPMGHKKKKNKKLFTRLSFIVFIIKHEYLMNL